MNLSKSIAGKVVQQLPQPRPRIKFVYSPFNLMVFSCWLIAMSLYGPERPAFPFAIIAVPVSIAFSLAYLAFDAWWHVRHPREAWSPWLIPSIAAVAAVLLAIVSFN